MGTRIITEVGTKEQANRILASLKADGKNARIKKKKYKDGRIAYTVWKGK